MRNLVNKYIPLDLTSVYSSGYVWVQTYNQWGSHSVVKSDIINNNRYNLWRQPSAYTVFVDKLAGFTGVAVQRAWGQVQTHTGAVALSGLLPYQDPSAPGFDLPDLNMMNATVVKALLKVKDQKVNAALAVVESRKTVDLVASSVMRIYRAYSAARKGNLRQSARILGVSPYKKGKSLANSWLELQYGWKPLLSDIHGAYEEVTRASRTVGFTIGVRAFSEASSDGSYANGPYNTIRYSSTKRCKVSLYYSINDPALLAASQVGLTNPATIAWELLPWSFVIDWFIPVGNVLEAMSAASGLDFKGGTITRTVRGFSFDTWSQNQDGISGKAEGSREHFQMNRDVYLSSPLPTFYLKDPFSTGHALNALALLRSTR